MKFYCRMSLNYKETAYISVHIITYMYTSVHCFSGLTPECNFSNLKVGRSIRKEIKPQLEYSYRQNQ